MCPIKNELENNNALQLYAHKKDNYLFYLGQLLNIPCRSYKAELYIGVGNSSRNSKPVPN